MDIHRCRFVPYAPAAINALAFNITTEDSNTRGINEDLHLGVRLAVGRANGDIEIWNPLDGAWVQETIFRGGKDRSVEGLAWIEEPEDEDGEEGGVKVNGSAKALVVGRSTYATAKFRLFSIGYSSTVTEWDLIKGLPRRHSSGNHSEVWCLAAQPKWQKGMAIGDGQFRGQNIVAGCADGTLVVLSTADDELNFQRFLSRPTAKRARVLSVAFQSREVVIAGYADGMIRVYDYRNGSSFRNISFGAGPLHGPRETLVWAVKCLPNGTIMAGDSTGEVRFFDGQTYSQTQRLSAHEADVLDVAVSADGRTAFSCGLDRRVVAYRLESSDGSAPRWAKLSRQIFHKHDIKTLAVHESRTLSVTVSGGIDTNLNVMPLRGQGMENARTISSLPQLPAVQSAPYTNLIASWWEREISVWRIGAKAQQKNPRQKVARMLLKGEENVSSVSITADGSLLAVATAAEVKVFHLRQRLSSDGKSSLKIRKINFPDSLRNQGARLLHFSPDGRWLALVTHESEVILARMNKDSEAKPKFSVLKTAVWLLRNNRSSGDFGFVAKTGQNYIYTINRIAFSPDSTILVVSDLSGYLDSWALEGREDFTATSAKVMREKSSDDSDDSDDDEDEANATFIYGQRWIRNPCGHELPRVDSAAVVLSFRPSKAGGVQRHHENPAAQPTSDSLHAHSQQLHHSEQTVFVLTAKHQIYEFDVWLGKLSDWSRKNPTKYLPLEFRRIRDRAMGCIWDVQDGKEGKMHERIWLYGSSWLSMLDLSHDFAPLANNSTKVKQEDVALDNDIEREPLMASKKRKRSSIGGNEGQKLTEHGSGAGSKIPRSELRGIGRKVRKSVGPDSTIAETVWLDGVNIGSSSFDSNNNIDDAYNNIGNTNTPNLTNGHQPNENRITHDDDIILADGTDEDMDHTEASDVADGDGSEGKKVKKWHCVYKYRPILGVVPLGTASVAEANSILKKKDEIGKARMGKKVANGSNRENEEHRDEVENRVGQGRFTLPEVAIVERPLWDLDLPPRFVGTHERER